MIKLAELKFYFYVQIVNFHLDIVRLNIRKKLQQITSATPLLQVLSAHCLNPEEVVVVRKIYTMIREMSRRVNNALGLVITFIFILSCITAIRNGYKLFRFVDENSTENIFGTFLFVKSKFLLTNQLFSRTDFYFISMCSDRYLVILSMSKIVVYCK